MLTEYNEEGFLLNDIKNVELALERIRFTIYIKILDW